nr:hypothetical protein Iba_chr10fCG2310 [Ipomoea batatas]
MLRNAYSSSMSLCYIVIDGLLDCGFENLWLFAHEFEDEISLKEETSGSEVGSGCGCLDGLRAAGKSDQLSDTLSYNTDIYREDHILKVTSNMKGKKDGDGGERREKKGGWTGSGGGDEKGDD